MEGYSKIKQLGKGTFGQAWLARDQATGKKVVVKFFVRDPNGLAEYLTKDDPEKLLEIASQDCDSARKLVQLGDPIMGKARFVDCLDNGVRDSDPSFVVLQVAGTETLEDYRKRKRVHLIANETVRIAKMILEGLVHMEGKYVHRDIKPENIMVHEDKKAGLTQLRLIDFGSVVEEGSTFKVLAGTPMFIPPEYWPVKPKRGELNITSDVDVYSAGEVLYELMCGRTFHAQVIDLIDHREKLKFKEALQTRSPRKFCRPREGFGPLFDLVVGKMLRGFPEDRWKASALLGDPIFEGVETLFEDAPDAEGGPAPLGLVDHRFTQVFLHEGMNFKLTRVMCENGDRRCALTDRTKMCDHANMCQALDLFGKVKDTEYLASVHQPSVFGAGFSGVKMFYLKKEGFWSTGLDKTWRISSSTDGPVLKTIRRDAVGSEKDVWTIYHGRRRDGVPLYWGVERGSTLYFYDDPDKLQNSHTWRANFDLSTGFHFPGSVRPGEDGALLLLAAYAIAVAGGKVEQ